MNLLRQDPNLNLRAGERIEAARLTAHGFGPLAPAASNDSEDGRAKNRRVELVKR